jgi:hypothetical protein
MKRLAVSLLCGLILVGPVDARGALVEGTVTPLEWAQEVDVCVAEESSESCTAPAANGSYRLSVVPAGSVRIVFLPSFRSRLARQYYDGVNSISQAVTIVLPKEESVADGINAELEEGGVIEGTVTAAGSGEPLPEVEVCAVSPGFSPVKSCGETDVTGDYELHSLPSGSYSVGFWGTGKSANYEPFSLATPVPAIVGTTTMGVDASLVGGAQIGGTVTAAATGLPLEGIPVCLFAASGSAADRCTESDRLGSYEFQGLSGGSYQVGFSLGPAVISGTGTTAEAGGFVPQYYDGVSTRAAATTISVLSAGTVEGVDAALSAPAATSTPQAAPLVANPIAATVAPVAEPKPKPKKVVCKKPKRKKKVKGKVRCVSPPKHKKQNRRGGSRGRAAQPPG